MAQLSLHFVNFPFSGKIKKKKIALRQTASSKILTTSSSLMRCSEVAERKQESTGNSSLHGSPATSSDCFSSSAQPGKRRPTQACWVGRSRDQTARAQQSSGHCVNPEPYSVLWGDTHFLWTWSWWEGVWIGGLGTELYREVQAWHQARMPVLSPFLLLMGLSIFPNFTKL